MLNRLDGNKEVQAIKKPMQVKAEQVAKKRLYKLLRDR